MGIKKQTSSSRAFGTSSRVFGTPRDYPDPPAFPSGLSSAEREQYAREFTEWWIKVKTILVDKDAEIDLLRQKLNNL